MQFSIDAMQPAFLKSVKNRTEKHGEEHVPALTFKLQFSTSNDILDMFQPGLKSMLYGPALGDEVQAELTGVDPVSTLPRLRCALLGPIPFVKEYAGYVLTIDRGLGGASNLVIPECTVDHTEFTPKEGGSVDWEVRVRASGLDAEDLGVACSLDRHKASVTLVAPKLGEGDAQLPLAPAPAAAPEKGKKAKAKTEPTATTVQAAVASVADIFAASKAAEMGAAAVPS
jgi:hypothetical protein